MTTEKALVMTVKEFLALTDRERNALVAEKVMGFILYPMGGSDYIVPANVEDKGKWLWEQDFCSYLPAYTTELSASWLVVNLLKAAQKPVNAMEHARISVTVTETADFSACSVEMWFNTYYRREGPGKTPLAICIAALLAVGALREDGE